MILSVSEPGAVLAIAPHPDDEVLGAGDTIARLAAAGREVLVCIATRGRTERFGPEQIATIATKAEPAHRRLGATQTHWLDHPAAELEIEPRRLLKALLGALDSELARQMLLVCGRHPPRASTCLPVRGYSRTTDAGGLSCEQLRLRDPNRDELERPLPGVGVHPERFRRHSCDARRHARGLRDVRKRGPRQPHDRSIEGARAFATLHVVTIHRLAAEGFVTIRQCR